MVSNPIFAGALIGVFFAGFGISYAVFASYDSTIKFGAQQEFDKMMNQNYEMAARWLQNNAMNNPELMNKMIDVKDDKKMSGTVAYDMRFNVNVPITMPMIDGYYNGQRIFFVHTEVSDKSMADMMTRMVNFPILHVPELKEIAKEKTAKVYVFTNGVASTGPYGGGPFMYQIDIFDSVPGTEGYSQFRVAHLVTWNDDANPQILTSVEELLETERNGELVIKPTEIVVNAPMIVWSDGSKQKTADTVSNLFESMAGVTGKIIKADIDMYFVRVKLNS